MHRTTVPTAPGALLGYRKNGAPIRLIAGGAPDDPAPAPADGGTDPGTGSGQEPPTPTPDPAPAPAQQPTEGDVSSLPDWAQKALKDARQEAGKARTTAKQNAAEQARNDLTREIGKALGLVKDEEPAPDPAALTAQLTEQQGRTRGALVELAIYKAATEHGANPAALADSRSFMDKVAALDPADAKFTDKVGAAIAAAVESNPTLATARPPAGRSGGDFTGAPGAATPIDQKIADAEKAGDHAEAIRLKRLRMQA